jgi:CDP-glucose 4,6-dehydratase
MKSPLQLEIHDQAINEIREQFLSSERAHRLLNWRAQFSLEEGLERTIAWYRRELAR